MKLKFFSLFTVLCLVSFHGETLAQSHTFANFERYAKQNKQLGEPQKGEKRVVFMGNSITDNWVKIRPEFFQSHQYIGRGIGGQTSFQFLLRFQEDVIKLKPKVVVINYGINDIAENTGPYNEDYTFNNVVSMIQLAQANKIKVVLTSCLPAKSFRWRPQITDGMQRIRSLNARVKAYAKKNKITFVDYFSAMLNTDKTGMPSDFTGDEVHPNAKAYQVMEQLVVPAIEKLR